MFLTVNKAASLQSVSLALFVLFVFSTTLSAGSDIQKRRNLSTVAALKHNGRVLTENLAPVEAVVYVLKYGHQSAI